MKYVAKIIQAQSSKSYLSETDGEKPPLSRFSVASKKLSVPFVSPSKVKLMLGCLRFM